MTELHIVQESPASPLLAGVAHVPSTPGKPIVVLKAVIGGTEQTWYVYGEDDEDVAHKLPRVHRYIQELRKKFGTEGESFVPRPSSCAQDQGHRTTDASAGGHDCEWHGPMRESTKAPGTWCCPKRMASGEFCKEKWPKRAGEQSA